MALVSGEIPDIMYVSDYTTVKQLAENDLIADLTDVYENVASDITKDMYDSYDGRCLNGASVDGRLMALPVRRSIPAPNCCGCVRTGWIS